MWIALAVCACGNGDTKPKNTKTSPTDTADSDDPTTTPATPRAVIVMIGDGMGSEHVTAGAWFTHGAATGLTMQSLPVHGLIRTGGFDGIGDSASCGTAIASGPHTWNGAIGMNRYFEPVENVLEVAAGLGWATGVVTTAEISHATPAVFTAHHADRNAQLQIAELQLDSPVDILLGGGWAYIYESTHAESKRTDNGLLDDMAAKGINWVDTTAGLAAATELPIQGAFWKSHLPYTAVRDGTEDLPTLAELATTALERLQDNPEGLFLMIEGARIDHASHGGATALLVGEVQTFDESIQAVLDWSQTQPHEVTLIVTADHETGGLQVVSGAPQGELPEVTWHWGNHTNADVPVFAQGPGTEVFDGEILDQGWVHSVLLGRITDTPPVAPTQALVPDGRLDDLVHRPTTQVNPSSLGDGIARLEAMEIDADADGLNIGIEGVFPWATHSISLLIDVDFGENTGPSRLEGYANDIDHPIDLLISSLPILEPSVPGFGIDLVVVSAGGIETPYLPLFRGLRGLHGEWGAPTDLGTLKTGLNYGADVRTTPPEELPIVPGEGYEAHIPWAAIWPDTPGQVPPGTTIAVSAILTDLEGVWLTNQALPPFPNGTPAPGTTPAAIPALVVFPVDEDGDGIASGTASPYVLP